MVLLLSTLNSSLLRKGFGLCKIIEFNSDYFLLGSRLLEGDFSLLIVSFEFVSLNIISWEGLRFISDNVYNSKHKNENY